MIPIEHFSFLVNISEDIIKKKWFFHNRKLRRKIWSIRIALICKIIIFLYSCRMLSLISGQFYSNSSSVSWIVLISGVMHGHIIYFECYTCSPHRQIYRNFSYVNWLKIGQVMFLWSSEPPVPNEEITQQKSRHGINSGNDKAHILLVSSPI